MIPYLIAGAIGFVVAKIFDEDEAPKYADGGSVLLAPNGNPSYLNSEQYKLVRSPAFKEWFGDWEKAYETGNYDNISKVIGYNMKGFSGEPLICSHSSYDKFNQFKTPTFFQEGEGGGAYGDTSDEDYVNYNVFLNIKNLLELRGAYLKDKFTPLISEIYKNAGLDDDEYKNRMEFAEEYEDGYGLFKLFEKPYWKNEYGYNWEWVFDYCKKNGYDGFVMRDSDQSMQNYITTWVALYPEQIKLADGTNTKFDGNNPDIRFDEGGDVNNIEVKLVKNNILSKKVLEVVTDELGSVGNPRLALLENGKVIGGIFLEPTNSYILNGKTFIEPYWEYKFDIFIIRSKRKKGYSKILLDAMIDDFVGNFPDSEQIRGEVINKKLEKSLEKYYGFSCDSGNEENILYCYLSKENALKLKYNNGGNINFNVERYRQIEKEMFELSTQGKGDTLEYFKLIKERSIL